MTQVPESSTAAEKAMGNQGLNTRGTGEMGGIPCARLGVGVWSQDAPVCGGLEALACEFSMHVSRAALVQVAPRSRSFARTIGDRFGR